ncbi:MAG: response regulator [Lachnospiraceae bacterium]|nr:response regulator [Lachnospiraceae bacterium]
MLKIFLVEDEYVVREGIKRIDWQAHGYEFAGEAPDGELALPLIDKTRPDIVITDIKMPFMDGLELSRQLRRDYASSTATAAWSGRRTAPRDRPGRIRTWSISVPAT